MRRERRLTIKVNHGIEIWSPVNFQVLRNKTLVYQEADDRWRCLDLLVLFCTGIWGVSLFSQRDERKHIVNGKKKHDFNQCGKPFSFAGVVCWLRRGNTHILKCRSRMIVDLLTRRVCCLRVFKQKFAKEKGKRDYAAEQTPK